MPCFQQEYAFVYFLRTMLVSTFGVKTSQIFYEQMLYSIFGAPMSFFFKRLHQEGIHTTVDPFAVELWKFMEEKKLNIDQGGYLYSICALCKGGYLDEALNLLKLLGENTCTKPGCLQYFLEWMLTI